MTYPNSTGFVQHSHTSAESARKLDESGAADNQAADIAGRLKVLGATGATADEMTVWMKENGYPAIYNGTVAGRLVHLEKQGIIVKIGLTRKTRSNRQAWVYVLREFRELCPPCPEPALKQDSPAQTGGVDIEKLRAALEPFTRMKDDLAPGLYYHCRFTWQELQALKDMAAQVCGSE